MNKVIERNIIFQSLLAMIRFRLKFQIIKCLLLASLIIGDIICIAGVSSYDSITAVKLSDQAWALKDKFPDSSYQFATKALKFARKSNLKKIEAYSLSDIGNYYKRKENYQLAEKYLYQSLSIRKKLSDTIDIASGFNLLGILYNRQERYEEALFYFSKAIDWLPSGRKYNLLTVQVTDGMSTAYLGKKDYEKAQEYLNIAINKATELKDSVVLVKCWQNQGVLYEHIGRSERALEFYTKAENYYLRHSNNNGLIDILINKGVVFLRRKDYKQSISVLLKAKELALRHGFVDNQSSLYNNLGLAYELAEEYELAEQQFVKGLAYADSLNKPHRLVETGLNLIRIKRAQKKANDVIQIIKQLEPIVKKSSTVDHLTYFYDQYAWVLGHLGRYEEAYQVKLKAEELRDSLNRAVDQAQLIAVEAERLSKEKKILEQEADLIEAKYKQENYEQRIWLFVTLFILSVLVGLVIYLNLKRKNDRQKLLIADTERKRLIEKKDIELNVRRQIGDALHDHLSNKLAIAQITMDSIVQKIPDLSEGLKEEYENVGNLLESYYHDVRGVAHQLMSENLGNDGLVGKVEEIIRHINKSKQIKTRFHYSDVPENLQAETIEVLLGIINIAIENTIRHSSAKELSIQVFAEHDQLHLTIEDDGKGFNHKEVKGGRGILNMNKRAKQLGGKILIETSLDRGTLINLKIPLKHNL